ncbi:MAG: nucleotidyltransferase family protein [Abditibacteriales bacterium]|nr:nucleotidyltransferase family protein [Abditibacteriales bacterium]MDW8366032.1 nucleotidyltransferase family protein [Abditibacteriales bacterium]
MKIEAIPAIVLAGDKKVDALTRHCGVTSKALIPIAGEPMVKRVVDVLHRCERVDHVVVIGLAALQSALKGTAVVEPGETLSENIQRGDAALGKPERVLVMTCDVPLITAEAIDHFIAESLRSGADITYPIVTQEVCEQRFPTGKRTYARLVDGTFTGGNMVVLSRRFLEHSMFLTEAAFAGRKSPLKLAKLFGFGFILKFLLHRLSLADLLARASHVLQCRAATVVSPYAEIAFDVDKVSDLEEVERQMKDG